MSRGTYCDSSEEPSAGFDGFSSLIERLEGLGYIYRGDGGDEGGHLFVFESQPDIRTIHLHVVEHGGVQWANYLRFRDLLRGDFDLRNRYAALKQELAKRFPADRKSYTASKHNFIRGILKDKRGQRANTHEPG